MRVVKRSLLAAGRRRRKEIWAAVSGAPGTGRVRRWPWRLCPPTCSPPDPTTACPFALCASRQWVGQHFRRRWQRAASKQQRVVVGCCGAPSDREMDGCCVVKSSQLASAESRRQQNACSAGREGQQRTEASLCCSFPHPRMSDRAQTPLCSRAQPECRRPARQGKQAKKKYAQLMVSSAVPGVVAAALLELFAGACSSK